MQFFNKMMPKVQWNDLQGTFGEFTPPGSTNPVFYVQTFATLAQSGTQNALLSDRLVPVRELLDINDLEFDELLQRDIDDHRVAVDIIPYLLDNRNFVRFFPPILAVVTPTDENKIAPAFPALLEKDPNKDVLEAQDGVVLDAMQWGDTLRLERYRNPESDVFSEFATLKINPDKTRLLILDGQHRAMAFLAIRRTVKNSWGNSTRGRAFKDFYHDLSKDLRDPQLSSKIDQIQLPICICFFPQIHHGNSVMPQSIVQACRKLFLDVNKQAKKPTFSRTLLLDDINLISVLMRRLLSDIRARARNRDTAEMLKHPLDIDSIEYDAPTETAKPGQFGRALALANIEALNELVYWLLFAKDDVYTNPDYRYAGGRRPDPKSTRFLKECQFTSRISSKTVQTWKEQGFDVNFDPRDGCPSIAHPDLADIFSDTWGKVVIKIFETLHPLYCHARSVVNLKLRYKDASLNGELAYRALFDGQGIFWTVQEHASHLDRMRKDNPELKIEETSVELAFSTIRKWIKEFRDNRASLFLNEKEGKLTEDRVNQINHIFNIINTQAFQIGVIMCFAYLKQKLKLDDFVAFDAALDKWIAAWNATCKKKPDNLRREWPGIMGCYAGSLKPHEWFWFRYMTFEYILAGAGEDIPGRELIASAVKSNRLLYLKRLAKRILKHENDTGNKIQYAQALELAKTRFRTALSNSFDISEAEFDEWYTAVTQPGATNAPNGDDITDDDYEDETSEILTFED